MPSSSTERWTEPFRDGWRRWVGANGLDAAAGERWLARLETLYGEPKRHYHTGAHVLDLLGRMEEVAFERPAEAVAAAYLHDAIYVVGQSDNEAKSADLAREALAELGAPGMTERVERAIRATAAHERVDEPDADLFLDIDMAVLGDEPAAYRRYRDAVMREYTEVVQREAYLFGRISLFIDPMLERERIFLTDAFAGREQQARENLADEREWLQTGGL